MKRFATILLVIVGIIAFPIGAMAQQVCNKSAVIDQAPGSQVIIPAVAGTQIMICGMLLTSISSTSPTAQLFSSGVAITGVLSFNSSGPATYSDTLPAAYNGELTVVTTGAHVGGVVSYQQ